jgi:surfactin synthase thioesterase subunit
LKTLGGLADRVLENEEVLDAILPLIQADLSIAENWQTADGHAGVSIPLAAVAAQRDSVAPPEAVALWSDYALGPFDFHVVPGTISSRTPGQRNLSHWLTARGLPLAKD